jgi:hypothetical protein
VKENSKQVKQGDTITAVTNGETITGYVEAVLTDGGLSVLTNTDGRNWFVIGTDEVTRVHGSDSDEDEPADKAADCDGCRGDGIYYGRGYVENGRFRGHTGTCYRCGGKGWQTAEDVKRNRYYDNRTRRIG